MCQPIIFRRHCLQFVSTNELWKHESAESQLVSQKSWFVSLRQWQTQSTTSNHCFEPSELRHCHKIVAIKKWKNIGIMSPNHQIVKWLESFMNHASELVKLSADKDTLDSKESWEFLDRIFFPWKPNGAQIEVAKMEVEEIVGKNIFWNVILKFNTASIKRPERVKSKLERKFIRTENVTSVIW